MNSYIVYEEQSTESTIQFIFDKIVLQKIIFDVPRCGCHPCPVFQVVFLIDSDYSHVLLFGGSLAFVI